MSRHARNKHNYNDTIVKHLIEHRYALETPYKKTNKYLILLNAHDGVYPPLNICMGVHPLTIVKK